MDGAKYEGEWYEDH
jgi:hypothetical protein